MAMPTDFWRNAQMLNIFRSKPCQRLARDGVCQWKSRCQFSHCTEWPRRPPQKHRYSPEICPNIQVISVGKDGSVQLRNTCTLGLACPCAHSMEEVLYHPLIFKTILCEEHLRKGDDGQRKQRGKKTKCHRYYCPFAHGTDELRNTTLTDAERDQCLRAIERFPSGECCRVCVTHRVTPSPPAERSSTSDLQQALAQQANSTQRLNGAPPPLPPHLLHPGVSDALSQSARASALSQNPLVQQLCQHHGLVTSAPKATAVPVMTRPESSSLFRLPPSTQPNTSASAGYSNNGVNDKDPFLMPPDESLVSGLKSPQVKKPPQPAPASSSSPSASKNSWLDSPAFITIRDDGSTTMTIGPKRTEILGHGQNFYAI